MIFLKKLVKFLSKVIIQIVMLIVILIFIRCICLLTNSNYFNHGWKTTYTANCGIYIVDYQTRSIHENTEIRIKVTQDGFIPKTLAIYNDYDLINSNDYLSNKVSFYWPTGTDVKITINNGNSDEVLFTYVVKNYSDYPNIYKE